MGFMLGIYQNTLKKHPTVNAIKYRDWPVWLRLTLDGLGIFLGVFEQHHVVNPCEGSETIRYDQVKRKTAY